MKTTRASLNLVSLLPVTAMLMAACAADRADPALETGTREPPPASGVPRAHYLPMPGADLPASSPLGAAGNGNVHMVYRGGPVISNVKIYPVYWTASVPNQSALDGFYGTIVNSPYVDWLSEYDTPKQQIGRGRFVSSYVDDAAPGGDQLTDDQVRQELGRLLDAGTLPQPDADTLFMVHLPAGVMISMDGNTSCQQFCAYHSSFIHGSGPVYYGIMPDFSGNCASCGGESTQLGSTTVVASHEVAEAMTDPNIGVANQNQDEHQLGWYDDQNSEIGDVCEGNSATVAGYRVTKLWSNKANACIALASDATGGGGGTGGGGTGGSGGGTGGGGTGGGGTGGGGPSCPHPICSTGAPLAQACGPCTGEICSFDPHCCADTWDDSCVQEAVYFCGKNCP